MFYENCQVGIRSRLGLYYTTPVYQANMDSDLRDYRRPAYHRKATQKYGICYMPGFADLISCARRGTERMDASRSEAAEIASRESLEPDHSRALLARVRKEVTGHSLSCYQMGKADDSSSK